MSDDDDMVMLFSMFRRPPSVDADVNDRPGLDGSSNAGSAPNMARPDVIVQERTEI